MTQQSFGYTLVEMLVAIAVTSIVLAGTYAAYTFFAQQQQTLSGQTDVDRSALVAIDLMQSDIRMAGYEDWGFSITMSAAQPIFITSNDPGDYSLVFDEYTTDGHVYRSLVRYYMQSYQPQGQFGSIRNRLYRERRICDDPSSLCNVTNSTVFNEIKCLGDKKVFCTTSNAEILTYKDSSEPLLDWVSRFAVAGLNKKTSGSFNTQFQTLKIDLVVNSPKKIEGTQLAVTKNFTFLARAKNVSLVP